MFYYCTLYGPVLSTSLILPPFPPPSFLFSWALVALDPPFLFLPTLFYITWPPLNVRDSRPFCPFIQFVEHLSTSVVSKYNQLHITRQRSLTSAIILLYWCQSSSRDVEAVSHFIAASNSLMRDFILLLWTSTLSRTVW
jgi:hypothetical protein